MKFIENILKNIDDYLILTDELGNEVWSNSTISKSIKSQKKNKNGIVEFDGKYYEPKVKSFVFSSQKYYLIKYMDVTRYILREEELSKDYLTKLYTREKITEKLNEVNEDALKNNSVFSVIIGDVDYFKKINDRFGHLNGDKALVYISNNLKELINSNGLVGRFGGEEFIIVLPNINEDFAFEVVEYIRKRLENNPLMLNGEDVNITMSFGISSSNGEKNIDDLIEEADQALYSGKSNGRNKTYIYKNEQK